MTKDKDYEVGHGKPPKKTQFKKGRSGNPKGRPKGSKNTMAMAGDIFEESIMLRENGDQKHVSKKEAMLRRLMQKAMEGDIKAMEKVLSMSKEIERRNDRDEAIMEYLHKRISDGLRKARNDPETLEWVESMLEGEG